MPAKFAALNIDDVIVKPGRIREHFDEAGLESLASSILDLGLLCPLTIGAGNVLIAGERRLRACRKIGLTRVVCQIIEDADAKTSQDMEIDENEKRMDLTPSEKVKVARRMASGRDEQVSGPAPMGGSIGRAAIEAAAEATGTSPSTLGRAERVVLAAEADPELKPVVEEMDRTGNVAGAFKKVEEKTPEAAKPGKKRGPKPKDKPQKRSDLKDAEGVAIPSHLRDLFGDPWFDGSDEELEKAAKSMKSLWAFVKAKGQRYNFVQLGEIGAAFETLQEKIVEIRANLGHGRPTHICPQCEGTVEMASCKYCRGQGLIPGHRLKDKTLNGD